MLNLEFPQNYSAPFPGKKNIGLVFNSSHLLTFSLQLPSSLSGFFSWQQLQMSIPRQPDLEANVTFYRITLTSLI